MKAKDTTGGGMEQGIEAGEAEGQNAVGGGGEQSTAVGGEDQGTAEGVGEQNGAGGGGEQNTAGGGGEQNTEVGGGEQNTEVVGGEQNTAGGGLEQNTGSGGREQEITGRGKEQDERGIHNFNTCKCQVRDFNGMKSNLEDQISKLSDDLITIENFSEKVFVDERHDIERLFREAFKLKIYYFAILDILGCIAHDLSNDSL